MLSRKTYRTWLSFSELPLQALIDLLEGCEPASADCERLEEYRFRCNNQDTKKPTSLVSEEELEGGLVEDPCLSLMRITYNGDRSSTYLRLYELAEKSIQAGHLRPSSSLPISALKGFDHPIAPIFWMEPVTFVQWARTEGLFLSSDLAAMLPDFPTWLQMETWPLHAACSLVFGLEPPFSSKDLSGRPRKLLILADNCPKRLRLEEEKVKPAVFIAWAMELVCYLPPELRNLADISLSSEWDEEFLHHRRVTAEQDSEPDLDEVDVAILKVLASYPHAVPFLDISSALSSGVARNRNTVSRRSKRLATLGLVSLPPRKGAQITTVGRSWLSATDRAQTAH